MISIKNNVIFNVALFVILFCFVKPAAGFSVQDTVKHRNGIGKTKLPVEDIYYQSGAASKEQYLEVTDTVLRAGNLSRTPNSEAWDGRYRVNHFGVDMMCNFYPALEVIPANGGAPFKAFNPSVFFSAGVSYSRFFKNSFGFKVGVRWGYIPVAPKKSQPFYLPISFYNYFQFLVCGVYRVHFKKNYNMYFSTGIAFDVMAPIGESIYNSFNNMIDVVLITKENAVFVDVPFEITASKVFEGKHELDFGLSCLMPLSAVGYGRYMSLNINNPASGIFLVRNEYIGIKIGYTFLGKAFFKKHSKKV